MRLYASSPDGLADQQRFYDQLNLNAGQNNASRYDAAAARALQASLTNREMDQRDQTSADQGDQFNRTLQFQAEQGDLNRASHERDVNTQYASTHADRIDALNDHDFQQAQSLAEKGLLPQTETEIAAQYPSFKPNQVKVLASASAQHAFDRFSTMLDSSIHNGTPLPLAAISKIVNPSSPLYDQAVEYRGSKLAPYIAQFKTGEEKARKGNLATKIQADTSATPLDQNAGGLSFFSNPVSRTLTAAANLVYPPVRETVQPAGDWQSRAPSIISALRSGSDPDVTTDVTTGKFINTMTNPEGPQPTAAPITAAVPRPQIDPQVLIGQAKLAIARGADPVAVKNRMAQQYGIQF